MKMGEESMSAEQSSKANSLGDHHDDQSSLSSDDTQAGVKNIEAISQTWTKWSLVAAYAG